MRVVELSLRRGELRTAMAEMRIWLDQRRSQPAAFSCREHDAGIVIRVGFSIATEAEAFAGHFRERIGDPPGSGRHRDRSRDLAPPPERMVG